MQRSHSPAYVAEIRNRWRIIVPVQGRLAPRICPQEFKTRLAALAWLQSQCGREAVELERGRVSPGRKPRTRYEEVGAPH